MERSLAGDRAGFTGPGDPERIEVRNILVMMDYLPPAPGDAFLHDWDLVVLHHPPVVNPSVPCYVIHSSWDIIEGGACDALADCLGVLPDGVLDESTGLGRVGKVRSGPVPLARFIREALVGLRLDDIRIVNFQPDRMVEKVGLISGFGLEPRFIRKAYDRGVDLYLSGDLTHRGALLAKTLGLALADAPHHATEVPGLYRLAELLRATGVEVTVQDRGVPWKTIHRCNGF